jgi:hypothetical protein
VHLCFSVLGLQGCCHVVLVCSVAIMLKTVSVSPILPIRQAQKAEIYLLTSLYVLLLCLVVLNVSFFWCQEIPAGISSSSCGRSVLERRSRCDPDSLYVCTSHLERRYCTDVPQIEVKRLTSCQIESCECRITGTKTTQTASHDTQDYFVLWNM